MPHILPRSSVSQSSLSRPPLYILYMEHATWLASPFVFVGACVMGTDSGIKIGEPPSSPSVSLRYVVAVSLLVPAYICQRDHHFCAVRSEGWRLIRQLFRSSLSFNERTRLKKAGVEHQNGEREGGYFREKFYPPAPSIQRIGVAAVCNISTTMYHSYK